ncbi:MAG: OmpH family outer membrane protein [Sphingomicrobium sp.]
MRKFLISTAFLAASLAPSMAGAQALPTAVVAVVDLDRVTSDCTACKTASAALKSQVASLSGREQQLAGPLKTEGQAIQKSIDALSGKAPDAALEARIKAFQAKQQAGAGELQRQQQQLQRNQAYIQQQIQAKLGPIYQGVMQRRGANVLMEVGSTLATSASVDVTADVVAALNAALPSLQTTAPAQPATPQGR